MKIMSSTLYIFLFALCLSIFFVFYVANNSSLAESGSRTVIQPSKYIRFEFLKILNILFMIML